MEIRLEHITKIFKNTVAVKDMNVTIPDGELVCLFVRTFRLWKKHYSVHGSRTGASKRRRNLF